MAGLNAALSQAQIGGSPQTSALNRHRQAHLRLSSEDWHRQGDRQRGQTQLDEQDESLHSSQ